MRLLTWLCLLAISGAMWLWPAAGLADAFYTFAKSHFTVSQWGGANVWSLVTAGTWSVCVGWLGRKEFHLGRRNIMIATLVVAAISVLFPAVGSALMVVAPIPFSSPLSAPLTSVLFLAEVPVAALVVARCMRNWREGGAALGGLKALALGLAGLTAAKVVMLALLPGVHIRLSFPLILPQVH